MSVVENILYSWPGVSTLICHQISSNVTGFYSFCFYSYYYWLQFGKAYSKHKALKLVQKDRLHR